jgi:hypothetical protein
VTISKGENQTFTIEANQNYRILEVLVDGVSVGPVSSYSFQNVSENHRISASFTYDDDGGTTPPSSPPVSALELTILEIGEVSIDHNWTRVTFNKTFTDPVVVAQALSLNDDDPAVIRIRQVDADGFEIRVQEWDYLDGVHAMETVGFVAMERGTYALEDGTLIEAGSFETDRVGAFGDVAFNQTFQTPPVVVASVGSVNESDAVTGRLRRISNQGFEFCLQEQELNAKTHAEESVHYIAWEPSVGTVDGLPFEVGKTADMLKDSIQSLAFAHEYETDPIFVADIQTGDGMDTANVRSYNKNAVTIDVQIDEEQSKNEETRHTTEVLGYMAFAAPVLIEDADDGGEDSSTDEDIDSGDDVANDDQPRDDENADGIRDFVTRFYQLCLDRNPDQGGLEGWARDLLSQVRTGADVAEGFIYSPEFAAKNTTNSEYLEILYDAFFDRDADPAGWETWMSELDNGRDRGDILDGFIYSQEFAKLCAKYGIKAFESQIVKDQTDAVEAFVTRFYQLCLDRHPDAVGLDDWTTSLVNQTQTGANVAYGFINSIEFIDQQTTNDEYLLVLYEAFFDRDPDPAGWDAWIAELNAGKDRGDVLDGFLYSQEFSELCQDYGINPY